MARYRVMPLDLVPALRALGLDPVVGPEAYDSLELDLEPVEAPSYADTRAEPLRAPLEALVARGLSNRAIAAELNDRGDFGPNGGLWHSSSIKRLRARLGV